LLGEVKRTVVIVVELAVKASITYMDQKKMIIGKNTTQVYRRRSGVQRRPRKRAHNDLALDPGDRNKEKRRETHTGCCTARRR